MTEQKYPVGTKFIRHSRKHPVEETVVDFLVTRNLAGEIVKTRYVTTHKMLGQDVYDYDVVATTIARSQVAA